MYPVPNPTEAYKDPLATGRCIIAFFDHQGTTCAIANIYGWKGGTVGSKEACRTDDLFAIICEQFETMKAGPKAIVGDFNGTIQAFPTLVDLIKRKGWTDIGADGQTCKGKPCQPTCHNNEATNETRIDFIITNERMTVDISNCRVEHSGDYPTHRPLIVDYQTGELKKTTKELVKPTNMAQLMEEEVQEEVEKMRQAAKEE